VLLSKFLINIFTAKQNKNTMADEPEIQALVVDNGSGMCKVNSTVDVHEY